MVLISLGFGPAWYFGLISPCVGQVSEEKEGWGISSLRAGEGQGRPSISLVLAGSPGERPGWAGGFREISQKW